MSGNNEFDFDVENALEVDRTEEFEDNLDIDLDEPAGSEGNRSVEEIDAIFDGVDGIDVFDPEDPDSAAAEELEFDAQEVPARHVDHSQDLDPNADWREETTVTDGRHVLDEFGEDVATTPLRIAEETGDDS